MKIYPNIWNNRKKVLSIHFWKFVLTPQSFYRQHWPNLMSIYNVCHITVLGIIAYWSKFDYIFQRNAYSFEQLSYIIELKIRLPSQSNYSFNYNIAGMRKGIHKSFLLHWLNITRATRLRIIRTTILWKYFIRSIFKHVKSKDKLNNVRISICYQLIMYMKTLKVESN